MTRIRGAAWLRLRVLALSAMAVLVAGCATGLEDLPLPARAGAGGGEGISLNAVFDNALNLPAKAKVKFNGADIGEVTSIAARDFAAVVTMKIRSDVPLYVGSTAQLRSATPLGDVFIAIKPAANEASGAARLHQGDTIPLGSTSAAATFEEVLSSAALVVNGGTVRRLVTVLNGTGEAVGGNGAKIATLLQRTNNIVSRLNERSDQLKSTLQSTAALAGILAARQATVDAAIAAAAPATSVLSDSTDQITQLTETAAAISRQLSRFPAIQGTDTRSFIADFNRLAKAGNDVILDPNVHASTTSRLIGIQMKMSHGAATTGTTTFHQLALGALPDFNYPGDPATHGPDRSNYFEIASGLRYEWNLLLSKLYGTQR